MNIKARADIEAPIDYVFEQVTDFATFERSIMRRGGDIERILGEQGAELGTKWRVKFQMRGKEQTVRAEIVQVDAPNGFMIGVKSVSADGEMVVELVALSRGRTRLIVDASATPKTIAAKLLFQSLKFARGKTEGKLQGLVDNLAKDIEKKRRG